RGEEDAGCYELILSGVIGRGGGAVAVLAALAIECAVLFALLLVVLLVFAVAAGDMTTVQASMVAAAIVGPAAVFAAVGALASQLAPTRRAAGAGVALAAAVFFRIVADIGHGIAWVRWITPVGWVEQVRPVTGARPAVLLLFVAAAPLVAAVAVAIARNRDLGASVLSRRA